MGGIPTMLLMIAAAGVTYGWQPDKNGDDAADVEYIVQVSPTELAQLQESGSGIPAQISSVIDPEVRGHVSRIVLRVGTGTLPRKSPSILSKKRVAALKPDPQSGSGGFGMPSTLQNSARDAVSNAANQFGNQTIDRAGRVIQNGANQAGQKANNLLDRIRGKTQSTRTASRDLVPSPSTRPATNQLGNNQSSKNQFGTSQQNPNLANQTLSSNPFAQPRVGGPSTAPTDQNSQNGRDNQWSRFAAQQQQNSQQQNRSGADASLASNGLRSTDTFGQMPGALQNSGLANSATSENRFANRTQREQDSAYPNDQDGIYSQIDQTKRDFQYGLGNDSANNQLNSGVQSSRGNVQQPRTTSTGSLHGRDNQANAYLGSSRPNPKLTREQLDAGGWDFDAYNRLVDQRGEPVRNADRHPNFADRSGNETALNGYSSTINPQQPTQLGNPSLANTRGMANRGTVNNSVYDRSSANNSSSMQNRDTWGYPIDGRDNRDRYTRQQDVLDRDRFASNSVTNMVDNRGSYRDTDALGTRYPSTNDSNRESRYQDSRNVNSTSRYADRGVSDQRYADQRYSARSDIESGAGTGPNYDISASDRQAVTRRANNGTEFASNLSPERPAQAGFPHSGTIIKPKSVAAQPLFNGLLLISIVANLYLLFWLKNLRVQFKDMVTAKRMATSSASVA